MYLLHEANPWSFDEEKVASDDEKEFIIIANFGATVQTTLISV